MFQIYIVKFSHPTYQIRKILRPYIINTHFRTLNFNIQPTHLVRRTWEFSKEKKFHSLCTYSGNEKFFHPTTKWNGWSLRILLHLKFPSNFDIFLTVFLHPATKFSHPATKFSHPATGWNGCIPMGMGHLYILNETFSHPTREWDILTSY